MPRIELQNPQNTTGEKKEILDLAAASGGNPAFTQPSEQRRICLKQSQIQPPL